MFSLNLLKIFNDFFCFSQTRINTLFDAIKMVLFPDFIDRYRFQVNNNLHLSFNPHEEISQLMKVLLLDRDLILLAGEFLILIFRFHEFFDSISRIFFNFMNFF